MENSLKIYVLKCLQSKYYVGKTTHFARRYDQHLSGEGSAWTKKYRPIDIAEVVSNADKYDEDKYVWKYMEKHGIENVRGGSYSQVVLPPELIKCAQRHIGAADDLCFNCNQSGHFIQDCPSKNLAFTSTSVSASTSVSRKRSREDAPGDAQEPPHKLIRSYSSASSVSSLKSNSNCYRCGRRGHWSRECYAKTHISGRRL